MFLVKVLWNLVILVEDMERSVVVNGIVVPDFEANRKMRFFKLRACGPVCSSIPVGIG